MAFECLEWWRSKCKKQLQLIRTGLGFSASQRLVKHFSHVASTIFRGSAYFFAG